TLLSLPPGQASSIGEPHLLDDGKHLLYSALAPGTSDWNDGEIVVQSLDGGARTILVHGGADGRLLPTGYVVYVHDATLFAVGFDDKHLQSIGGPVPVLEGVAAVPGNVGPGPGQFAVSATGTIAYRP